MEIITQQSDNEFLKRLRLLIGFRVLFITLLLGSTIVLQLYEDISPISKSLLILYCFIAGILALSLIYILILPHLKKGLYFAYIQIIIDTLAVSLIIFLTGGFSSIFSFLYLVVIIYASMLIFRKGGLIMAGLCSIQYGIMVVFECFDILHPYGMDGSIINANNGERYILYRVVMVMIACFAVAFLSGILSEQIRKTKEALFDMEEQVKRVEKMAVIGEMAAGLAHEIKNPLASLTGSIQMLRDDLKYDADSEKLMQIVIREAERLNTLLCNFLFFAKPPSCNAQAIDLARTLGEVLDLFEKDKCCRGRIIISRQLIPAIFIEMDQVHLRQIVWNLLLNAAESIENQGNIRVELSKTKNRYACITVADTGKGIAEENLKKIFNPFFSTKQNGSGLGLSIVHRILESYNGQLDVKSTVGKGTTFKLNFKIT